MEKSVEVGARVAAVEEVHKCPLCGGTEAQIVRRIAEFTHLRCATCHLVRLSPRIAESDLGAIYGDSYPHPDSQLRNAMHARRYAYIERYRNSAQPRQFFELGCGDGGFLAYMQQQGWQVSGSEYSVESTAMAAKRGIPIEQGSAEDLVGRIAPQSVVGFYHVLEHVYHLQDFMKAVRELVVQDGIIHVQVPNLRSADSRLTGKYSTIWQVPQHVQMFEPATIRLLLQQHGFRLLHIQTYDPWYGPGIVRESLRQRRHALRRTFGDAELLALGGLESVADTSTTHARAGLTATIRHSAQVGMQGLSFGFARAEALLGWGNVIDVVAKKS